jgi:glucoamylase
MIHCALVLAAAVSAVAPGAPGGKATWTNGNKQGVGTAVTLESKVWFTLGDGALTETYYPTLDRANTRLLELVVADGQGFFERETEHTRQRVERVDARALAFRQVNESRSGRYRITKTTFTDPGRPVVLVSVRFEVLRGGPLRLYAFFDPAVNNSGLHDTGVVLDGALVAEDAGTAVALASSSGFRSLTTGYLGTSDGLAEVRAGREPAPYRRSVDGNVAQLAELSVPADGGELTLALAYAGEADAASRTAREALSRPSADVLAEYVKGWSGYLDTLRTIQGEHAAQFAMSAMVLRALEDKTYRGAMIASLTKPWGNESDASEPSVGGYHLVWSRDLYHVATAFHALGDKGAADRALNYLFEVQQKPDGSFPQNSWLDGRPYWTSLQLDEVAYPLILAHQLGRTDGRTYVRHIRPAAQFIVNNGPATPQERWEEESGYSPSTIAAEIAGLLSAAAIADQNDDREAAIRWRLIADDWAARLEQWTVTTNGPHAKEPYFLRLTQHGKPTEGTALQINNGGGVFDERQIVDAGFLELVRLGIRPATDPRIRASLAVIDRVLRVETPRGPAFYRYNQDGYGEKQNGRGYDGTGVGRLWPLLTGERGEYELAAGADARPWLKALGAFAGEGDMLPEQVWDKKESPRPHLRFGEGTGSATPLAWAHAQFIRLALGIEDGRLIGPPAVVKQHFSRAGR